jgi:hypothetical protein
MAVVGDWHARCATPWRALLVLLACTAAGPVRAQDYYFVMVFGSQQDSPTPSYSHTWATFVKATPVLPQGFLLEADTISWLPENGVMRVAALLPEPGRNFDLESTVQWALNSGQHVFMWGPYQIDPVLYRRARAQKALLESGTVRYKAIDTGRRSDRVSNCIHAVAAVADGHRLRVTTFQWGESASALVARALEPWLIHPGQTYDWIATGLGLGRYGLVHRGLDLPPRRFGLW